MDRDRFVAERQDRWRELDALVASGRALRHDPVAIRRLADLTRHTASDLAIARRRFRHDPLVTQLGDRVLAGRRRLLGLDRARVRIGHFVTTGYWRRVRERPVILLVAFLFLMVPWLFASVWATHEPAKARGLVPGGAESVMYRDRADFRLDPEEKAAASSAIFTNNIRVAFLAFALGIAAGVGALLLLGYQGVVLGATFGLTIHVGNAGPLFQFVFPHGFLELSCIIVAGAAGMRMGWAIVAPGYRTRNEALRTEAAGAVEMVAGTALVLVLCGIVEGTVSTSGIPVALGVGIGVLLGGGFWSLVLWRGRPERVEAVAEDRPTVEIAAPRAVRAASL
ncbi:MAG: stage II sporulation protein M [Actinobacteria bacterium]|nr:stage II sporulation protein M [Actinomycetota bacterium]MBS1900236.1 stage II sporulation protein M [Actinomycetota bacterium]